MRKISILAMIIALCLCACGDASEVNSTEKTVETAEVETLEEETNSEAQPVEETQEEVVEEVTEEEDVTEVVEEEAEEVVEGPQDVVKWAESVDKTEPKLTIWNDVTKEGTILENGNTYTFKEGDQLVICYEGEETNMTIMTSSVVEPDIFSTFYKIFNISKKLEVPTEIEMRQTVNGVEYIYQVTLISEEAAASFDGDPSEYVSGEEWAASLEYDYPKLLAWNDELNTKVEIEEGQEYTMQSGDVLAIHAPQNYIPFKTYPESFFKEWETGQGYYVIQYNTSENNSPINLVIEGWLGEDEYELTCTLIPPTE